MQYIDPDGKTSLKQLNPCTMLTGVLHYIDAAKKQVTHCARRPADGQATHNQNYSHLFRLDQNNFQRDGMG